MSLLCTGGLFFTCFAQSISTEVIGTAGEYYLNSGGFNLHWTVGEIAISNFDQQHMILAEGFHQTYLDIYITDVWKTPENEINIAVFPNPAQNWITIDTDYSDELQFKIINISGQQVITAQTKAGKTQVDIQNLPAGMYLLNISKENQLLKSFKILKSGV